MKYILRWVFICFVVQHFSIFACTCDGEACDKAQYGYRRAFLREPVISTREEGDPISFRKYFIDHDQVARKFRETLIISKAFTSKSLTDKDKIKEIVESKDKNIASFGFVFFNQDGDLINERPFYFSPSATVETLEEPFFFLSGRRQRDPEPKDPYRWIALPEAAPKCGDLRLLKNAPQKDKIEKTFPDNENLKDLLDVLPTYSRLININLHEKAVRELFFNCVNSRTVQMQSNQEICRSMLKLLKLRCVPVKIGKNVEIVYYPAEKKQGSNQNEENEEGDFTHSEQYALFQTSLRSKLNPNLTNFEVFLEACIQKIQQLNHTVGSYAILIYTYNIMCVRCSQSVIFDFQYLENNFNEKIKNKLNDTFGQKQRSMVFLAGYSRSYESKLYGNRPDCFEKWVKDGTRKLGDLTTTMNDDDTFGYTDCSPEEAPEMIYHWQVQQPSQVSETIIFFRFLTGLFLLYSVLATN